MPPYPEQPAPGLPSLEYLREQAAAIERELRPLAEGLSDTRIDAASYKRRVDAARLRMAGVAQHAAGHGPEVRAQFDMPLYVIEHMSEFYGREVANQRRRRRMRKLRTTRRRVLALPRPRGAGRPRAPRRPARRAACRGTGSGEDGPEHAKPRGPRLWWRRRA